MRNLILVAAAAALAGAAVLAHSDVADPEARHRALVETAFSAWRNGTGSPFELLADDATWTIVGRSAAAGTYSSKEAFLREVIRPFNERMREPLKPEMPTFYTDGDTVVALFDAAGRAKDGKPYVNTYAWFLQMRDGRIIAGTAFFDSIAFDELWTRVSASQEPSSGSPK